MSKLAEFRALEQTLAAQLAELESMKSDASLKVEIEFESKLLGLMKEHDKSLKDIVAILDPQNTSSRIANKGPRAEKSTTEKKTRRLREMKRYKHPESGEIIETKGGNHTVLKEWKAKHGGDTVESWRQQ